MPEDFKNIDFPIPLQEGAVYGPIHSKRLGLSLGINLLPTNVKVCNLDCLYCFYGRTDFKAGAQLCPSADSILVEIESHLKKQQELDYITFSGNGAATLHPEFPEIVKQTAELRNKYYPGTPLAILSNSTGIDTKEIFDTFKIFDHPMMKLDTGDEKIFRKLNRPKKGIILQDIINLLKSMRGITIQTLFADGIANHEGDALEKWVKAIAEINPAAIQIYTLDRSMPENNLIKLDRDTLQALAEKVNDELHIPCKAFLDKDE
jgi:wyosine [tRNA(Phe)-imidazoG37] synthetase (radical SAM superfamily)